MSDLISKSAALDAVSWDSEAYFAINMLPTIDAVPVADHYETLLAEKAKSWKEGFEEGIEAERRHNETVEELARNGFQEDADRSEE